MAPQPVKKVISPRSLHPSKLKNEKINIIDGFAEAPIQNLEVSINRWFVKSLGHKLGGYAYIERRIEENAKSIYTFKILNSSKMDIWIGLEQEDPKYEWWLWLKNGVIFQTQGSGWEDFTKEKISKGGEITMGIEDGAVTYFYNKKNVGTAFWDDRLKNPNSIHPIVFLQNKDDVVGVEEGQVIRMVPK